MKFAIAVGRFYTDLAERLVAGAQRAFTEAGHGEADVFDVPGAFELPLAARYLADSGRYAGVACLGAVIRGETDHYDYVCAETARGIMDVQLTTGVPLLISTELDVTVAGSSGSLNVSVTAELIATPVALAAGTVEITVGRVVSLPVR